MAEKGRQYSVTNGWFREAKLQWRLYGDELGEGKFASRPVAAGGGNRKQPLAPSPVGWKTAVRYALVLLLPELRLCSGSRLWLRTRNGSGDDSFVSRFCLASSDRRRKYLQ